MASAVDRAAQLLLPSFSLRRRASGGTVPAPEAPPPPPPVAVPVLLLTGEEAVLGSTEQSTLLELQGECQRATGVPPTRQRLCVLGAGRGGVVRHCLRLYLLA